MLAIFKWEILVKINKKTTILKRYKNVCEGEINKIRVGEKYILESEKDREKDREIDRGRARKREIES